MAVPRALVRLAARAKPFIPDAVWPTLVALRSLAGDGPVIGVPAFERALVLVAHPDDEAVGCAGTIAMMTDAGAVVEIWAATDGEGTIGSPMGRSDTATARRSELAASAEVLGATCSFAHLPDGGLSDIGAALGEALQAAIDRSVPQVVFAPWLGDGHADHRALAFALADCTLADDAQIWGYETWSALPHNRLVPIEEALDRKRAALAVHETASLAFDISAGLGLSRWRSMHGLLGVGHGEAFLAATVADYRDLARELQAFDARSRR